MNPPQDRSVIVSGPDLDCHYRLRAGDAMDATDRAGFEEALRHGAPVCFGKYVYTPQPQDPKTKCQS